VIGKAEGQRHAKSSWLACPEARQADEGASEPGSLYFQCAPGPITRDREDCALIHDHCRTLVLLRSSARVLGGSGGEVVATAAKADGGERRALWDTIHADSSRETARQRRWVCRFGTA
jgi:hypothetical protein